MLNLSGWRNFLYVLPAVLVYAVFLLFPLLASLGISFTEWDGTSLPVFSGVSNYLRMFSDPVFWIALGNNAILMLFYTLLPIGVGLLLCSFLYDTRNNSERSVLRILFSCPTSCRWRCWAWCGAGSITRRLVRSTRYYAQSDCPSWRSPGWVILPGAARRGSGRHLVLLRFLSGAVYGGPAAHGSPLLEAADLDGSSRRQKFMRITLPGLRPELRIALLLTVIASLKAFDLVYVMTQGGPGTSTMVTNIFMYKQGFDLHYFGYASSVAVFSMVIVLGINYLIHLALKERY